MTLVVPIRLNAVEFENLNELVSGSGGENRSEFIRLLIHREFNRRRGIAKPLATDYRTIFRVGGRPKRISSGECLLQKKTTGGQRRKQNQNDKKRNTKTKSG